MDGVAAVQARIAQIQQLVSGTISALEPGAATTSASSASASTATDAGGSPEFASLLADAMASSGTSDPLSDSSSSSTDAIGGTNFLSELGQLAQLTQSGTTSGTTDPGALSALTDTSGLSGLSALSGLTDSGTLGALTGSGSSSYISGLASLAGLTGATALSGASGATTTAVNPVREQFLTTALGQQGKPYVYGATASISDPSPKAFDCSELTKWAAGRVGVTIPDGATAQYLYIRDHGDTMTVQQALHTPGALLFHFGHEPKNLGDIPADGHVAISVGDGVHTIEARGHAYGTNVFDNASGRDFNFAGVIPGMT